MRKPAHLQPYYPSYRWMRAATQTPSNPDYAAYGAQGITCYWGPRTFFDFQDWLLTNLGDRPQGMILGRKDKSGNFEPGNLEWQTVQRRSRTKIRQNIYLTHDNETKSITEWGEELDIPYHTFRRMITDRGMTVAEVIKESKQ